MTGSPWTILRRPAPLLGAVGAALPPVHRDLRAPATRRLLLLTAALALSFALVSGATADSLEWSADGVTPGSGGTGTWNTNTALWFNGIAFQNWNNAALDDAIFGGTAGTVTLGKSITAHDLIFDVTGYSVTRRTLTLGGVTPAISVVPGGSATIDSTIAGAAGLTETGGGTLILTRNNNYTGGTTISAGTLQLGDGGTRGAIQGDVLNGGVLAINRSNNLTYNGVVSGTGALTKAGAGRLTLSGDSTYAGGTTINAGTLRLGNNGTSGSIVGDVVDNATLEFNRSDDLIFAGDISGTGALTKNRGNMLTLTGDNTYTGGTTISSGTLQLGNGGTSGSIVGDVVDNATLDFNRSDDVTFGGIVSGNGSLTKSANNTLTLTGDNTYTGNTTISAGTLQLGDGGTTGSVARNILDNAALIFNRSDALTYDRVVSGTGSLTQAGSGMVILTKNNTYTGGTTISAGTLQLGDGGNSGIVPGDISDNGVLVFNRSNNLTYGSVVSGTGALTQSGPRTLTLTGDNTYTGITTISAGTLQLGNNSTSGSIVGNVLDDGVLAIDRSNDLIFAGDIGGTGAVTKNRANTLTLTGENTYTGGTTISDGALQIGNGGTTGSIAGDVANSGMVVFDRSDDLIFGGIVSGNGSLIQAGTGTTILTGANIYTGGTTINAGTLQIGNGGTTGSVTRDIVNNSELAFDRSDALIYDGVVSGSGALTQVGSGTTILTGTNTYTGGTTISAGTLQIGNGGTSGSILGDVVDNGLLAINRSDDLTFGGIVSGTGALTKVGTNTLTLTGDNTYTGATTISAGTLQLGNGGTSGSIVGDVIDNGVFAINRSDTVTLGGVISGTGTLTKSGAGTLILTGENTFGGGTTINAGTLQIGNGGTTGSISGNMVDNGVFVFDRSDALTYAGNISGTGSLVKNGAGTLTLTGVNPYSGGTTINAGKLLLSDAVIPAPVVALPAAFLGGIGTVGPSMIAGTLAPGFSIGTITVSGNMTFAAPGVYLVEISPTAADRTNVTGAATLAGGSVQVQAETGTYTLGTTFTILNAAGGVTGTFAGLTSDFDSAFLAPELSYDANNVFLTIARSGISFASVGETPNEIATGGAVEALGSGNVIFDTILSLTAEQARHAFDALSGEVHASLSGVLVNQGLYVREAMLGRLIQASYASDGAGQAVALAAGGPTTVAAIENSGRMALGAGFHAGAIPDYGHGLTFWTRGFGSWGQFDGNGNAATAQRTLGGFISGMDAGVGDGWRAGLATGYIRSDIDVKARASSADVDSYLLAGYAGGRIGRVALRSGAAWTWHSIDTLRAVSFPGFYESESASYGGDTGQLFAELAYPIVTDRSSAVEPFAGLAYVHVGTDDFTESGTTAALTTLGSDENVGYSTLGVRAATTMPVAGMLVTPRASVAWQYAFGDVTPDLALAFASSGIAFGISGIPLAHNSALIEAGLDFGLGQDAMLGVSYAGQLAGDLQDNGVQGRFTWRF